jgi:hypothetical protein
MTYTEQKAKDAEFAATIAAMIENPDRFQIADLNALAANGVESIVDAKVVEIDGVDVLFVETIRRAMSIGIARKGVRVSTGRPQSTAFVWTTGENMRVLPMSWRTQVDGRKSRKFRRTETMYPSIRKAVEDFRQDGARWIADGRVPGFEARISAVEYAD